MSARGPERRLRIDADMYALESVLRAGPGDAEILRLADCQPHLRWLTAGPRQRAAAEAFHGGDCDLMMLIGGNRSGKSVCAAALCLGIELLDHARDGANYWIIAQTHRKSVEGPQRWLWETLPRERFSRPYSADVGFGLGSMVEFEVGDGGAARIDFKTEEEGLETFESSSLDGVFWDEASRESLLGRLLTRVMDRKGWIVATCIPDQAWTKFRVELSGNPRWKTVRLGTHDNAANLPAGAIDALAAGLTPEERAMRIAGEHVLLSGVLVPEFRPLLAPAGHLVDAAPLRSDQPKWVYMDTGYYTAALLCTIDRNEHIYVADEVHTEGKRVIDNVEEIRAMMRRCGMDSAEAGSLLCDPASFSYTAANEITVGDQYVRAGLPFIGWPRTQTIGERATVNLLRQRFAENTLFIHEKCTHLIRELQTWRRKMDDQQRVDLRELNDVGPNHSIDCIKAFTAARRTYAGTGLFLIED